MRNTLFLLLAYLCFACNPNNTNTAEVTTDSTDSEATNINEKIVIAQYESAAVYPAHVEYGFYDENDNLILVKEDAYDYEADPDMEKPEEDNPLKLPPRMLEDEMWLGEEDAFAGANPALIGQNFKLYYNKEGYIYKVEKEKEVSITRMIYHSAAVYPMHTTYEFLDADGANILFNVDNEESTRFTEIPDNMLEDEEDLEGLPGENPELVGRAFDLYFNKDNRVVKVELVKL